MWHTCASAQVESSAEEIVEVCTKCKKKCDSMMYLWLCADLLRKIPGYYIRSIDMSCKISRTFLEKRITILILMYFYRTDYFTRFHRYIFILFYVNAIRENLPSLWINISKYKARSSNSLFIPTKVKMTYQNKSII